MASFDKISMAGLWFEYVWDQGFAQDYDYKCSTWIVLSDETESGEGSYVIYNNMLFPKEENAAADKDHEQDFIKFRMQWDAPTEAGQKSLATYLRTNDEEEEESGTKVVADSDKPSSKIQFINTDYH